MHLHQLTEMKSRPCLFRVSPSTPQSQYITISYKVFRLHLVMYLALMSPELEMLAEQVERSVLMLSLP